MWALPPDVKSKHDMMMSKLKALKLVRSIPKIPNEISLPQQSEIINLNGELNEPSSLIDRPEIIPED